MFDEGRSNKIRHTIFFTLSAFLCFVLLMGCGGDDDESGANASVGSVQVSWSPTDCPQSESLSIVAIFYDAKNTYITYGGPWKCSSGTQLVDDVTYGIQRKIALFAEGSNGKFRYRGEKRDITVEENAVTFIDDITLYSFVATPLLPANGRTVEGSFSLIWNYVVGASKYKVIVADNSDFLNPIITEEVNSPSFVPSAINSDGLYYWKVSSIDIYGNASADSEVWQFTIPAILTTINSPDDGDSFMENNEIYFLGEAIDPVEGILTKNELVWSSDLDGILGYGAVPEDILLSVGRHVITLTASNSLGWSSHDSITINIIPD